MHTVIWVIGTSTAPSGGAPTKIHFSGVAIDGYLAIEPTIGRMKTDGRFARNWLKDALGDTLQAVLRGADHKTRMQLKKPRPLLDWIISYINVDLDQQSRAQIAALT